MGQNQIKKLYVIRLHRTSSYFAMQTNVCKRVQPSTFVIFTFYKSETLLKLGQILLHLTNGSQRVMTLQKGGPGARKERGATI